MIFLRVKWNEVAQSCLTLCNPMDYSLYDLLCDLPILCTNHYHMVVFSRYVVSNSCNPMDWSLLGSSVHEDSPGKNTGVGCHFLLQGIFPTEGSNPGLLHCRLILYQLSYEGSPSVGRPVEHDQIDINWEQSTLHHAGDRWHTQIPSSRVENCLH